MTRWSLLLHDGDLVVVRLPAAGPLPAWATSPGPFNSVTRTANATSVVCRAGAVPPDVSASRLIGPLRAFQVDGTVDPAVAGVIAELAAVPAAAGISVFAMATFDTDWILVPAAEADRLAGLWRLAGHPVAAGLADRTDPSGTGSRPGSPDDHPPRPHAEGASPS